MVAAAGNTRPWPQTELPPGAASRARIQPSPCARARKSDDGLMSLFYLPSLDVCSACSLFVPPLCCFPAKTERRRAGFPSYLLVGSDSFVFFVIRRLRAALPAGFWICLLPLFLYLHIRCIEIPPTPVPLCLFLLASTCLSYSIHLIFCSDLNLSLFPYSSSSSFHWAGPHLFVNLSQTPRHRSLTYTLSLSQFSSSYFDILRFPPRLRLRRNRAGKRHTQLSLSRIS